MARNIIHLQLYRQGMFAMVNTTLCQRQQWQGGEGNDGGNNVSVDPNEVTCKLCLKDRRFKDFKEEYNRNEAYKKLNDIDKKDIKDAFLGADE